MDFPPGFVPDPPSQGTLPPGFVPDSPATAPAPEVSMGQSAARGALQGASMGFGDEAAAAIDTAVSQVPGVRSLAQMFQSSNLPSVENPSLTYAQRRDAYRQANANAQQANPLTYGAGELAGAVATAPAIPSLAGRGIVTAATNAAIQGGAAALGSSDADLTKGQFMQAAKDTAGGAALGGLLGGALHGVGSKVAGGAENRMMADVGEDLGGTSRLKDRVQLRKQMLSEKGDAEFSGRDVVMADSTKPILDAARAGRTEEAVSLIKPQIEALEAQKTVPYATVEKAAGKVPTKTVAAAIDARVGELAKVEGTQGTRKALQAMKADIESVRGADGQIPVRDMRSLVTKAQDTAIEAANANGVPIAAHAQIKAEAQRVLSSVLDQHMAAAAGQSLAGRTAVQQIRNINKTQSVMLSMSKGLQDRLAREAVKRPGMAQALGHAVGLGTMIHGVGTALSGHPAGLAMLAAPTAARAVGSAGRVANDSIARLLYQAQRGNPAAVRMLAHIRSVPQAAARLAGMATQ